MKYNVVEKFFSIDGEGPSAGEIAVFIRFAGCNLRCGWCDTKYSIENIKGETLSKEDILQFIKDTGADNVMLTGGEPLIQEGIKDLFISLSKEKHLNIHTETNGSIDIEPFKKELKENGCGDNVSFIVDYKLPSSQMESFMIMENLNAVGKADAYKFVIGSREDLPAAKEIIDKYNLTEKCKVFLSPVLGSIEPGIIVDFMKEHKLNGVKLQLQLHKIIWEPDRRGV